MTEKRQVQTALSLSLPLSLGVSIGSLSLSHGGRGARYRYVSSFFTLFSKQNSRAARRNYSSKLCFDPSPLSPWPRFIVDTVEWDLKKVLINCLAVSACASARISYMRYNRK